MIRSTNGKPLFHRKSFLNGNYHVEISISWNSTLTEWSHPKRRWKKKKNFRTLTSTDSVMTNIHLSPSHQNQQIKKPCKWYISMLIICIQYTRLMSFLCTAISTRFLILYSFLNKNILPFKWGLIFTRKTDFEFIASAVGIFSRLLTKFV